MDKIAILTSTAPLRKTTAESGRTRQRINPEAVEELAEKFDVVIIGSLSHDEVFGHIQAQLPRRSRHKFRMYPRSFFHAYRTPEVMRTADDPRSAGWEKILMENHIAFEPVRSLPGPDGRQHPEKLTWQALGRFITDPRVILVSGSEGQLFFDAPEAAG